MFANKLKIFHQIWILSTSMTSSIQPLILAHIVHNLFFIKPSLETLIVVLMLTFSRIPTQISYFFVWVWVLRGLSRKQFIYWCGGGVYISGNKFNNQKKEWRRRYDKCWEGWASIVYTGSHKPQHFSLPCHILSFLFSSSHELQSYSLPCHSIWFFWQLLRF